jgi:hypothetical protein
MSLKDKKAVRFLFFGGKMTKQQKAQVVFEYIIIFVVFIAALAGSRFIRRIKDSFNNHFNQCKEVILEAR